MAQGRRAVRAGWLGLALALLLGLAGGASARADVLVHAPDPVIDCGEDIQTGVWYQSYSGGPRGATIAIRSIRGYTLGRKRVRATTEWRYWYYTPRCGRRYRVAYKTPGGRVSFPVRVRGASSHAAAAAVTECGNWGDHGDGHMRWGSSDVRGFGIYNMTTRRVACGTARRFARRYNGTDTYYPTWRCREVNDHELSDIRCTASRGRVIHWQTGV